MYPFILTQQATRLLHSADLGDMRRALSEDDDGPDGGAQARALRETTRHEARGTLSG